MHPIRLRQWGAVLLLMGSVASLVGALLQSGRAVDLQGPGALVSTAGAQVWVGVDGELWRLGADGRWIDARPLQALGLPGAPSTLNRLPDGGVVATVRDDPTLYLLDPERAAVRGTVQPQWPAALARHGGRAINLAWHADGRIAIATGGGHAVALFDAQGRFLARTPPDLYRFTNGLWWAGDELWTTDTNRTELKRLDGRTLALRETVSLDAGPAARYLGPARAHPAEAGRVALIRFRNGMIHGRVTVLDGVDAPAERPLPQAQPFAPVDVDWLGDEVLASDGDGHRLLRIDAATGLARDFGDGLVRERLAQGLQARARHWLAWKLGLAMAAGLLLAGFGLAWQAQRLQRRTDPAAAPLDLAYLGTPRLPFGQQFGLSVRVLGPWLLALLPVAALQFVDARSLGLGRHAWLALLATVGIGVLVALGVLQRRQARLAEDPAFEPLFNAQAVRRLDPGRGLRGALRPDETVLETMLWFSPTLRWLVLTDLRLLCFVATLRDHRLEWAFPRAALGPAAYRTRAASWWSRGLAALLGHQGRLALVLPDGRRLQGRVVAPTVARRLVAELEDPGARSRSATLPVAGPRRAGSGPGPRVAALLSLLVPGLGQWLQRRAAVGLMLFLAWAMFVGFVALPLLLDAWAPRYEVPATRVLGIVATWVTAAAVAAWDAWRMAPRSP